MSVDRVVPQSEDEAVEEAIRAISESLASSAKRRKKGRSTWAGVKRLAVEVPIAAESPAAQLALATRLASAIPAAAGPRVIVFGSEEATSLARARNVPYEVYSVAELERAPVDLEGSLMLFGTASTDAGACARIAADDWSGRVLLVANAEWLRTALPPPEAQDLAESLDPVYFFLPVSFGGFLGMGRTAFLIRRAYDNASWRFYLDEGGHMSRIGAMDTRPSNEDMEAMLYNASAAKSPLTAGAKLFGRLTRRLRPK